MQKRSMALSQMFKSKSGMVANIIGLVIAIIVLVAVAIPITNSVIDTANLTGITGTIVGFIPVFLALAGLALVAFSVMGNAGTK